MVQRSTADYLGTLVNKKYPKEGHLGGFKHYDIHDPGYDEYFNKIGRIEKNMGGSSREKW